MCLSVAIVGRGSSERLMIPACNLIKTKAESLTAQGVLVTRWIGIISEYEIKCQAMIQQWGRRMKLVHCTVQYMVGF